MNEYSDATGRFDFALANPLYNVNAVDTARVNDSAGSGCCFRSGLPGTDNANFLWIQPFHAAVKFHALA